MTGCLILLSGFANFSLLPSNKQGDGVSLGLFNVSFVPYVYNHSYYAAKSTSRVIPLRRLMINLDYASEKRALGEVLDLILVATFEDRQQVTFFLYELFSRTQRTKLWRYLENFWNAPS